MGGFQFPEMEFLHGIFSQGFESSQTRVSVWFSTLLFPLFKMLFMNRLEFSCFADFFVRIFLTIEEYD